MPRSSVIYFIFLVLIRRSRLRVNSLDLHGSKSQVKETLNKYLLPVLQCIVRYGTHLGPGMPSLHVASRTFETMLFQSKPCSYYEKDLILILDIRTYVPYGS